MSAPGYGCMAEGCTRQVSWLVTHMNPAATFSLCDDDFPVMVIQILATELGTDPEKLYDAIKRHVDREAARQAKTSTQAARARSPIPTDADLGFEPGKAGPDQLPAQDGPPVDKDKCPVCKAGVIIPGTGMCGDCAAESGQAEAGE